MYSDDELSTWRILFTNNLKFNFQVFGKLIVNSSGKQTGAVVAPSGVGTSPSVQGPSDRFDTAQDSLTGSMASTAEQWCSDTDTDLKEHMVSILFSRSKLSHLQKQVSH